MARPRRALALAAALSALWLPVQAQAQAQGLRSLHVDALSMRADKTHVAIGETFHLAIHVRVRERITALDELEVPDVGTMHLLGDERHAFAAANGTDVVETLTLEPVTPGPFTFPAAYFDAVDANTKKPSRFAANPVRVVVTAPLAQALSPRLIAFPLFAMALVALGTLLAALALVALVVVMLRRERKPVVSAPAPAPLVPPAPPRTPRDDVADAVRAYRSAPADGALRRLRATLFAAAGVPPGATLRDALANAGDDALRPALSAAEHAAFGPAHARDDASRELLDATDAWLR
jgi:hypothetical protein